MTATAARTTSGGVAGAAPETALRVASGHEHAWALMRFELVDDRPVVRQSCETCGLTRGYRAWERYWTPGEDEVRR